MRRLSQSEKEPNYTSDLARQLTHHKHPVRIQLWSERLTNFEVLRAIEPSDAAGGQDGFHNNGSLYVFEMSLVRPGVGVFVCRHEPIIGINRYLDDLCRISISVLAIKKAVVILT